MAHANNTPRGLLAKAVQINIGAQEITANSTALLVSGGVRVSAAAAAIITGNSTGIVLSGGVKVSNAANAVLTGNSTGVVLNAGIRISNSKYLTANSTGVILTAVATKPATDNGAAFTIISNSTGVAMAINSTGTTWKYFNLTSVQPT